MVTDHVLHRVITGTLSPIPDELSNPVKFLRHFHNEIVAEYACFFDQDKTIETVMEFDQTEYNGEIFEQTFDSDEHQGSLISFYQPADLASPRMSRGSITKLTTSVDVKLQVQSI